MMFIRKQSSVSGSQFHKLAIMFSRRTVEKLRLIILNCDEKAQARRVVKVGPKRGTSSIIEREADLIARLPQKSLGSITVADKLSTSLFSAFSMPYCVGQNPPNDQGAAPTLRSWLNPGPPKPLESFNGWHELVVACGQLKEFQLLNALLAGQCFHSAIHHGDFAPWNIRIDAAGEWKVFDWERGVLEGIPSWDWFHFVVQTSILAKRDSPQQTAAKVEELISSTRFQEYAEAARITQITKPLLLAYLLHQQWVIKPDDGVSATKALHELLSSRWQLTDQLPAKSASTMISHPVST